MSLRTAEGWMGGWVNVDVDDGCTCGLARVRRAVKKHNGQKVQTLPIRAYCCCPRYLVDDSGSRFSQVKVHTRSTSVLPPHYYFFSPQKSLISTPRKKISPPLKKKTVQDPRSKMHNNNNNNINKRKSTATVQYYTG